MMQNLEGKAKDDANLFPVRISKEMKREKEREKDKKAGEGEKEKMIKPEEKEHPEDSPLTLPDIMHEKLPATSYFVAVYASNILLSPGKRKL